MPAKVTPIGVQQGRTKPAGAGQSAAGQNATRQSAAKLNGAKPAASRWRSIALLTAGALLLLLLAAGIYRFAFAGDGKLGRFDIVANVNGEPIAYGELEHFMEANRSTVFNYFHDKYGAEDSPSFWTDTYGSEVPLDKLKTLALEDNVKRKVQQLAAIKNGLPEEVGYRKLLNQMETTNADRQKKVDKGEIIYGPVTFDEQRYIDQDALEMRRNLQQKIIGQNPVTNQEASDYYNRNKQLFALGDARKIRAIEVSFKDTQDKENRLTAAKSALADVQRELDSGTAFDVIYDRLLQSTDGVLTASETVYDYRTPRTAAISSPVLLGEISKLDKAKLTGIVEQDNAIGIYECADKYTSGYSPLDQAMPQIVSKLTEEKYDTQVDQWVKEAQVDVNSAAMDKVTMK